MTEECKGMLIQRAEDGRWSAMQTGELGRMEIAFGATLTEAMEKCRHKMMLQRAEAYHHEEAMSHLTDCLEGQPYGEDLG